MIVDEPRDNRDTQRLKGFSDHYLLALISTGGVYGFELIRAMKTSQLTPNCSEGTIYGSAEAARILGAGGEPRRGRSDEPPPPLLPDPARRREETYRVERAVVEVQGGDGFDDRQLPKLPQLV